MADEVQYDENKLALTEAKGQLTKGLNKLDESCKEMASMPDGLVNKMLVFCILNYSKKYSHLLGHLLFPNFSLKG